MRINAEIVYATEVKQELISIDVDQGTTVADAIELSCIRSLFPGEPLDTCQTGIWGRLVDREHELQDGDRIELYRKLQNDPRDARRERSAFGQT